MPNNSALSDQAMHPELSARNRAQNNIGNILAQQRSAIQQEKKRRMSLIRIAIAFVLIVVLLAFFVSGVSFHSDAMSPTVSNGDSGLVWKLGRSYEPGDIVLFRTEQYGSQVLRIVARQGDSVSIDSATGAVLVNGTPLEEPYVFSETLPADVTYPLVLDAGEYFLLGDNRSNAKDSRYTEIGPVSKDDIIGKLFFIFRNL